jgi:hypothetical protein
MSSWPPLGPWIKRFEVVIIDHDVTFESNVLFPLGPLRAKAKVTISAAQLVGQNPDLMQELRKLLIDMKEFNQRTTRWSALGYLYEDEAEDALYHLPQLAAFRNLVHLE